MNKEKRTFFMVFIDGGYAPSHKHYEIETAIKEAKRLCEKEGKKSYVLEAFFGYEPVAKDFNLEKFPEEKKEQNLY